MDLLDVSFLEDLQTPRGLDTVQATSFFPWWLLLFSQENSEVKGDL